MITICSFIVIFTLSFLGISYAFSMGASEEIASYNAQKQTIEQSLDNENISGLERIELVEQASSLNSWLAKQKVKMSKWSKFDIKQDIKDRYNNAEYISLE